MFNRFTPVLFRTLHFPYLAAVGQVFPHEFWELGHENHPDYQRNREPSVGRDGGKSDFPSLINTLVHIWVAEL
jgi:hypothetical protein